MKSSALAFFLLWAAALSGQEPFRVSLSAGLGWAGQTHELTPIDYRLETRMVGTPVLSLAGTGSLSPRLSYRLALSYAAKGSSTDVLWVRVNHENGDRIEVETGEDRASRFHYLSLAPTLQVPLLAGPLRPYVWAGPRIDVLLAYRTESEDPLEEQNKVLAGVDAGCGVRLERAGWTPFVECGTHWDAVPVWGQDPLRIRNRMVAISFGATVPLSR
ncbi:MAG: hypothetical protein R2751_04745 [Bacteroidales bacterium]